MKCNFKQRALKLAIISTFAVGSTLFGANAYSATGTGTAEATVVTPISIVAVNALRFGAFSTSAISQTVTIGTNSARSNNGTLLVASNVGGAASFTVSGADLAYTIGLPVGSTTIAIGASVSAPEMMSVGTYVSNPTGSGGLVASGTQTLLVGATLTTSAAQVAGQYTGTFPVTVEYN